MNDENDETLEAKAERLWYEDHPTWPKRWGWTEVPQDQKQAYRERAARV